MAVVVGSQVGLGRQLSVQDKAAHCMVVGSPVWVGKPAEI